ncbi:MAG: Tfp pilus assembly protein PilN, partial [Shewanella sp.]
KQLSDEGKKPTLALIKTKLGVSVAMLTLIQGLQQYKSMNAVDRATIKTKAQMVAAQEIAQAPINTEQQRINLLEQELLTLKADYQAVIQRLTVLESASLNASGAKK